MPGMIPMKPNDPEKTAPIERLSPSEQRARLARLTREAPTLERSGKGNYGAFFIALLAALALVGLTVFKEMADRLKGPEETRSDLVEVDMAKPEDLLPRTSLAERIAGQLAAEEAAAQAEREAAFEALDALSLQAGEPGGRLSIVEEPTPAANWSAPEIEPIEPPVMPVDLGLPGLESITSAGNAASVAGD